MGIQSKPGIYSGREDSQAVNPRGFCPWRRGKTAMPQDFKKKYSDKQKEVPRW